MNKQKHLELRPDRNLLDPNFNGYKLSLEQIPFDYLQFESPVDKVLPSQDQYSFLYTKLFALHNHLNFDKWNENFVYFVDKQWSIQKCNMNLIENKIEISKVWDIPISRPRKNGDYNISMIFPTDNIAILADGTGILHIVNTGNRNLNGKWSSAFCEQVLSNQTESGFVIIEARCEEKNNQKHLNCILMHIEQNHESLQFQTVLNWITISQSVDGSSWGAIALRKLIGKGGLHYCALEKNCEALYLASDYKFKFVSDSENEIKPIEDNQQKVYLWEQTKDNIKLTLSINEDIDQKRFNVSTTSTNLKISYNDKIILELSKFYHALDPNKIVTNFVNEKKICIVLNKLESGLMWPELVEGGDQKGLEILDEKLVEEAHQRLAHLCSETEEKAIAPGLGFSPGQQLEECDAIGLDEAATFERISTINHEATHVVSLGGYQVLFVKNILSGEEPPSLAVRYDVDACIWQPETTEHDWNLKHLGTLLAFGYVHASKEQRRFTDCSPDMSYTVISESTRYAFVYRQHREIREDCQLRNRNSGHQIKDIAEQQLINIEADEVLGLHAANKILFILTTNKLFAYLI